MQASRLARFERLRNRKWTRHLIPTLFSLTVLSASTVSANHPVVGSGQEALRASKVSVQRIRTQLNRNGRQLSPATLVRVQVLTANIERLIQQDLANDFGTPGFHRDIRVGSQVIYHGGIERVRAEVIAIDTRGLLTIRTQEGWTSRVITHVYPDQVVLDF